MKKALCLLLTLFLAMSLFACGGSNESNGTTPPTGKPGESTPSQPSQPSQGGNSTQAGAVNGYVFEYNGVKLPIGATAAPLLAQIGEHKGYTESTSCAFPGLDKTYFYGSFYLTTCPDPTGDTIFSIWIVDDSVSTAEGIYIGAPQKQVESVYGTAGYNGMNAFVMDKEGSRLTVIITDGVVSSIQYDMIATD